MRRQQGGAVLGAGGYGGMVASRCLRASLSPLLVSPGVVRMKDAMLHQRARNCEDHALLRMIQTPACAPGSPDQAAVGDGPCVSVYPHGTPTPAGACVRASAGTLTLVAVATCLPRPRLVLLGRTHARYAARASQRPGSQLLHGWVMDGSRMHCAASDTCFEHAAAGGPLACMRGTAKVPPVASVCCWCHTWHAVARMAISSDPWVPLPYYTSRHSEPSMAAR
jgi:hypothetical protein